MFLLKDILHYQYKLKLKLAPKLHEAFAASHFETMKILLVSYVVSYSFTSGFKLLAQEMNNLKYLTMPWFADQTEKVVQTNNTPKSSFVLSKINYGT